MALAVHTGGPADGAKVFTPSAGQVRYYAPAKDRQVKGWIGLARYVFVPPRDKQRCTYQYTGIHQVQGPAPPTDPSVPDWS